MLDSNLPIDGSEWASLPLTNRSNDRPARPTPRKRHHFLSPLIERGIDETNGPAPAVFNWLRVQAKKGTAPLVGIADDGAVLYETVKRKEKRLTYDALQKQLRGWMYRQ